jgi:hypothetical protein
MAAWPHGGSLEVSCDLTDRAGELRLVETAARIHGVIKRIEIAFVSIAIAERVTHALDA